MDEEPCTRKCNVSSRNSADVEGAMHADADADAELDVMLTVTLMVMVVVEEMDSSTIIARWHDVCHGKSNTPLTRVRAFRRPTLCWFAVLHLVWSSPPL